MSVCYIIDYSLATGHCNWNNNLTGNSLLQAVVKGLHHSMKKTFGNGLELFVPKVVLKPGDDMNEAALSPATVAERPLLTADPSLHLVLHLAYD